MMPGKPSCPSCGREWEAPLPVDAYGIAGAAPHSLFCPQCTASPHVSLTGDPTGELSGCSTANEGESDFQARAPGAEDAPASAPDDGTVGGFATVAPSAPDAALNWQEGALIADRFRIIRFVGQGGMGKVFLAQDETLARPIALKCVPQEIIFDGDARDDLRQEASRLLDLAHDNIVRIHTYYDGPTWPFFAMEYLEGPTLKRLLRQRKQLNRTFSVEEVLLVARQVARGLAHAHSKGIIHRDLKPGNLMLAESTGETLKDTTVVKITDFGVSRVVADSTLRQTGKRSGTIPYMSPEQFRGEPCTPQSDVYSFACTLYELLEGRPPFHTGDVGYQILHKPPSPLTRVTRPVGEAILRGLAKQPQDRFPSVEAFLQALHGETKPKRRFERVVRTAVAAAALLAIAAGVVSVLPQLKDATAPTPPVAAQRPLAQAQSEIQEQATEEFVKRLRDELEKQIPSQIGRDFSGGVSSKPDTISLKFSFPEHHTSNYQRSLLEHLVLLTTGDEAREKKVFWRGKMLDGAKVFELAHLAEGLYTLRAYLENPEKTAQPSTDLFQDLPHKFRIDLTPPTFDIVPVQPDAFIDPNPPLRLTFYEAVDLKLAASREAGDIAEAYVALALGEVTMPWERLTKLPTWRIELPPGVTTTYRVYARDAARNRSAAMEVSLRRLRLDVDSFGLALPDGVVGNLATVTGILRVEGDQSPTLKYFVQDRLVEPESTSSAPLDSQPGQGGLLTDPTGVPFTAVLRLPSVSSTIEVRYAWRDNPPQSFARPMRISDVTVRPPVLFLEGLPRRTAESRWKLSGRLEPYFEGLELGFDRRGQGSQRIDLFPTPLSSGATFKQEVQLLEGENTFLMTFSYKGDSIAASQKTFSIYCDKVPPALEGPARFEPMGDLVFLTIRPTEELKELRVEEVAGPGKSGAWRVLEKDPSGRTYTYSFPVPVQPLTLRIEMTDLADLIGRSEHLCPITRADLDSAGFSSGAKLPVTTRGVLVTATDQANNSARVVPSSLGARPAGATLIASRFVEDVGLEFVPFGQERLEISRTELSQRAWYLFLDERGYGYHGAGLKNSPMVLDDFPPEILRELVKWFEERSNDGYAYSIPAADEWLMAFGGVNDPSRARQVVKEWFHGDATGGARFDPSPEVPYGSGQPAELGSRKSSRSPTQLLDMEANVQEVVLDGSELKVIGGTNADRTVDEMLEHSLESRLFDATARKSAGKLTGLRLVRRPAKAK